MNRTERWESIRAADGRWQPPVATAASTVVLLRGDSVLLLERSMSMPFAPGMHVFPGGGVSHDDRAHEDPRLACAIRETLEEVDIALESCHLFDRWVTPEVEDRRYDVSFYFAHTKDEGRLVTSEAVNLLWLDPAEALHRHRQGALPMLRPTIHVLETIDSGGLEAATKSTPVPKLPRMTSDGEWQIVHAETHEVLESGVVGPASAETDGSAMELER